MNRVSVFHSFLAQFTNTISIHKSNTRTNVCPPGVCQVSFSTWNDQYPSGAQQMIKFTLRIDDEKLVKKFDELADIHGMTRTAFIIQLMQDAVNAGYVPLRDGEGYRALADDDGEITITRHSNYVSGGMRGLNKKQEAAYELAKELASPEQGSQWIQARSILEQSGFKVYRL